MWLIRNILTTFSLRKIILKYFFPENALGSMKWINSQYGHINFDPHTPLGVQSGWKKGAFLWVFLAVRRVSDNEWKDGISIFREGSPSGWRGVLFRNNSHCLSNLENDQEE